MKNLKQLVPLALALSLLMGAEVSSFQLADARPKQAQVKKEKAKAKNVKTVKKSQPSLSPTPPPTPTEDDSDQVTRNGPPDWAPAWGYRCNRGENVIHPGKGECNAPSPSPSPSPSPTP